jgi:isopentenyl-diphosphate delta-isomerase
LVAVASLPPENARRTALITHGSPLSTFYRPFFPRFFTEDVMRTAAMNVGPFDEPDDGGWINFYRDTDPVGNPIFAPADEPETLPRKLAKGLAGRWGPPLPDVRLLDPWRAELVAQQPPPTLLIHSSYANDPTMARAVMAAVQRLEEHPPAGDQVVLVDGEDTPHGSASWRSAHSGIGQLHRAFSVFVFDADRRLLMQRRAADKPTFGGLWANTCCSHPRPGEAVLEAAERRLREEMGLTVDLHVAGGFEYRAEDPTSGFVEHEYDHVLVGTAAEEPDPDEQEVADWAWVEFAAVRERALSGDPAYAPWLAAALEALPDLDATPPDSERRP